MKDLLPLLADRVDDADLVIVGETHILPEHRLLESLLFGTLKEKGFNSVFLELDHGLEPHLAEKINLPVQPETYWNFFEDEEQKNDYLNTYLEFLKGDKDKATVEKLYQMHLSRDYNFFPGMHGNRLSYHQMLKAAALQMTHIYAVDCEVEFSGVDPAQPKTQTASGGSHISGMIARNDFMADRIASRMKKGKSIAIVGGYHLTDFSEDGQTVLSLQSLMAQKYGVKAATVRFADYLGNLQTEIPALEQHFPQAEAAFEANKFFIIDNAESGTGLPQHIVVFPHDQILENYKIYGEKDDPNPSYRFTREKRYWNKVCLMSGCLSLAI